MKKYFLIILICTISFSAFSQDINVGVETNVLVEDKSVEAMKEMYKQENLRDYQNRVREIRAKRRASWKNKELTNEDLSSIEYIILMPPENWGKKIRKRFKKVWPKDFPEYVNLVGSFQTHKRLPSDAKVNRDKALYMFVETIQIELTAFDSYIELYDYTGKLVYANSDTYATFRFIVEKLISDLEFYYAFN
tara:strand:- start:529 stop:1104 length:576 start_codon:yes stop_codon:yes gene_type:complete